ncbi:hypothetical protein QLX52_33455, partial [Streptomyces albus]
SEVGQDPVDAEFWSAVRGGDTSAFAGELGLAEDAPLSEVLPALEMWRTRRTEKSELDSWRYDIDWVPAPVRSDVRLSGCWLVVTSAGSVDREVVGLVGAGLRESGAEVTEVVLGADLDRQRVGELL